MDATTQFRRELTGLLSKLELLLIVPSTKVDGIPQPIYAQLQFTDAYILNISMLNISYKKILE